MSRNTALLVIDAQVGIIEGPQGGPVHNKEGVVEALARLVREAREKEIPVLYVQDLDVADQDDPAFQVHPAFAPQSGEIVVHKTATDSFHGTPLHEKLQQLGIDHLVIGGCQTEYCVDSACRRATTLGYDVTLVREAHSTKDNGVLTGEQIVAHHNRNLHGLSNVEHFIIVRSLEDSVFEPIHDNYR